MNAIQEISVERGGFNAEYGQVRSGLINVITKEGGKAGYSGAASMKVSPASAKHFGVSPYDASSMWNRPYLDDEVCWTGTQSGAWDEYTARQYPEFRGWNKISEELFILRTNGGDEYCGQVIQSAVNGLNWSENNEELKLIFIAGNEPFTQGKVDYKEACKEAISKGIIVNTIFCGNYKLGIDTWWKDGADRADGKYINIDQNQQIVHIDAPQDKEIMKLSDKLNKTYIAYGREGEKLKERQEEQDMNAKALGNGVYTQRAVTKSTSQYKNIAWDLVDAEEEGAVNIEEFKEEELPEEMKGMKPEERKAYIEEKRVMRKEFQEKINKLNAERRKYVAEQRSQIQDNTLDAAIINAIIEQAQKKNYKFE